jgi:Bacteriophage tail sheath protein
MGGAHERLEVAESCVTGVELAEESRTTEHVIERVPTGIAAFVGRTLKGPVNHPVSVGSFVEFQQIFGGLWQPSTLSYALEQFFENGGRRALIVRVVNGARPPTITLAAGNSALKLIALNPGSREYLRASVDYDGIGEGEGDRFNLCVQRVRSAASELIEDQEIFRRVSVARGAGRFVADLLLESRLVRVTGPVPARRPDRSVSGPHGAVIGYAVSNPDGDDGGPLTDYDVIGSAIDGTGLFALNGVHRFNMLCIPPLTRDSDLGSSTLLVAARFCRERQALLLVDPPSAWLSARTALDSMRTWPFRSDSAVMFFPRVQAFDRLRGRVETFASCGAAAGLIARSDETCPVWSAAENEEAILRPGLRPAAAVSDSDRLRLAQAGINTLVSVRSSVRTTLSPRTLAAGGCGISDWKYLSARRLAVFIAASIEQGTRWVTLEHNGPATWERASALVDGFLGELADQGAFVGTSPDDSHFVIADSRVNRAQTIAEGKFNLLYGFATSKPGEFDTWLVTHQAGASRVRPVSVNRATTSRHRVEWEIETSILRS